jgi:hypothetical protein
MVIVYIVRFLFEDRVRVLVRRFTSGGLSSHYKVFRSSNRRFDGRHGLCPRRRARGNRRRRVQVFLLSFVRTMDRGSSSRRCVTRITIDRGFRFERSEVGTK